VQQLPKAIQHLFNASAATHLHRWLCCSCLSTPPLHDCFMTANPSIYGPMQRRLALLGTAVVLLTAGCTYSHGDPAPACDVAQETITYQGVIAPIIAASCLRCHGSTVANTLGGGKNFGSYASLSSSPQNTLLGCVRHDPGYSVMPLDGGKLSDCDIKRLETWYALGKPQ
jgi:cytochrome c553